MPVRTESRVPQSWCLSRSQRARQSRRGAGQLGPQTHRPATRPRPAPPRYDGVAPCGRASSSWASGTRRNCDYMPRLSVRQQRLVDVRPHRGFGYRFCARPRILDHECRATAVEALTCSALAGTAFLPFTTLAVCGRLCGALYATDARAVSRARGTSPWRLAVGDLLTASLPVQALYAATVVAIAIALSLRAGQANLLGAVLASLAPRLALALAVNESFIACALALYRLIPNRAAAFGVMAVGFIAACVAQLSFPTMILPIHAGLWMHISSATALHTLVLPALVFSGITGVIALALYAHMQR